MSDRQFYEAGAGNEVTSENMAKAASFDMCMNLGAAATAAVTAYIVVPCDCYVVGSYTAISADPSTSGATVTLKNGSTTYATHSFASGASAGDGDTQDVAARYVAAGTVLTLTKAATTTAACTAFMTVKFTKLDA